MKLIYKKKINKTIVVTLRSISMGVRFGSAGDRLSEIISGRLSESKGRTGKREEFLERIKKAQ